MKRCGYNGVRLLKRIKGLLLVAVGTLILAVGTAAFLIPYELVSGGISGIAILLHELSGGSLAAEAVIALLSWSAFFIGFIFLGKSFALKTLLSTALYPLFISLVSELRPRDFLSSLLPDKSQALLGALLGGLLVGIGLGLSFISGGSTGGVDVLALVICNKKPKLKPSRVILLIDASIILFGALIISDAKSTLLGIFSAAVAAFTIEAAYVIPRKIFNINLARQKD